ARWHVRGEAVAQIRGHGCSVRCSGAGGAGPVVGWTSGAALATGAVGAGAGAVVAGAGAVVADAAGAAGAAAAAAASSVGSAPSTLGGLPSRSHTAWARERSSPGATAAACASTAPGTS